jgi:hypothetical protein
MKFKIPTQLILLAVLAALGVTGWIYIYSCRDKAVLDLQTITGDPSCLSDKKLDIQIITDSSSFILNTWNLDIGFSSGPVLEDITYENVFEPDTHRERLRISSPDENKDEYNFGFWTNIGVELPGLWINDETARILNEYNTDQNIYKECEVGIRVRDSNSIEMDGMRYFTVPDYEWEPMLYYYLRYEWIDIYDRVISEEMELENPVKFHAKSGIWSVD